MKKKSREPSHAGREKTLKKAVYGEWFKKPKEPTYHDNAGFSGGYGNDSFNGERNQFKGKGNNLKKKGKGKRMERSKWLRMYWARKNAKGG